MHMHGYMHALASYVHMCNVACEVIARTCSIPITNTFADKERQSGLRGRAKFSFFFFLFSRMRNASTREIRKKVVENCAIKRVLFTPTCVFLLFRYFVVSLIKIAMWYSKSREQEINCRNFNKIF